MTILNHIKNHNMAIEELSKLHNEIEELCQKIYEAVSLDGTIFWMGNGGSAADAQHLSTELMVRYEKNRPPIKSIALTTDTSLLTAHTNDFEFDSIFSRQIESLASKKDVVIGISTSGNSRNVLEALKKSREIGALTIGLLGNDGGSINEETDMSIIVPSKITANIQECHILVGHYICSYIESRM